MFRITGLFWWQAETSICMLCLGLLRGHWLGCISLPDFSPFITIFAEPQMNASYVPLIPDKEAECSTILINYCGAMKPMKSGSWKETGVVLLLKKKKKKRDWRSMLDCFVGFCLFVFSMIQESFVFVASPSALTLWRPINCETSKKEVKKSWNSFNVWLYQDVNM